MHYSVIILPLSAILLALSFKFEEQTIKPHTVLSTCFTLVGIVLPTILGVRAAISLGDPETRVIKTVADLKSVPGTSLFVWGHQANILLLDGRSYGSRFYTCAGLTTPHPRREEWIAELSSLLSKSAPDILVFGDSLRGLEREHPALKRLLDREMPRYRAWPVQNGSFPIYVKR
jgi:hypothetical protein